MAYDSLADRPPADCITSPRTPAGAPWIWSRSTSNGTANSVPSRPNTRWPLGTYCPSAPSSRRTLRACVAIVTTAIWLIRGSKAFRTIVNSTAFAPGTKCGSRWSTSPAARSSFVSSSGVPPPAGTRMSPPPFPKTIVSSDPQLAPTNLPARHICTGRPPVDGDPFQDVGGPKPIRPAVGRKERIVRAVSPREGDCLPPIRARGHKSGPSSRGDRQRQVYGRPGKAQSRCSYW